MKNGIKVFAPASVANVAVGFDVLGFALDAPGDEIVARFSDTPGLRIAKITGGKLPAFVHLNVGYKLDNSGQVVSSLENTAPPAGRGAKISRIERE